jgi:predicted TIM-barrel fold metal-dependent hydrolase
MTLPPFDLHRARSVEEAQGLLERYGEDAAVICGGTELLLLLKLGFAAYGHLVDIKGIEELVVNFPEARVILGHMGHGNVVYINGAIEVALRNPNVYLETSGMPMHTKIKEAYERVGETRVLFGSDVPFHHPVVELAKVRLSGLPPEAVERVLSKNARALFFGDENAEALG